MTAPQKISQLDQTTTVDVNDLVVVVEVPITTLSTKKMEVGDFLPDLTDGGSTLVRGFGSLEFSSGLALTDLGSRFARVNVDLGTLSITELGDVPNTFTGAGTFVLRVNATEDAVEFVDLGSLGVGAGGTQGQVQFNDGGFFGAFGEFVPVDNSLLLNGAASSIAPGSVASGIFSAENSTLDSTRSVILGGVNHNLLGNTAVATVAGTNNDISSSTDSGIFAGINNTVTGAAGSAAIAGDSNQVLGARSVALGGTGLVAVNPDTVYVPQLNINQLGAGAAVQSLGLDAAGNVVDAATLGIAGGLNFGIQYNNSGALDGWGSVNPASNQWVVANVGDSTIDAASTNVGIFAGFGNSVNSASNFAVLAGGRFGVVTNSQYAGVFAGQSNRIINSGDYSVVVGGENNIVGVDTGSTVVTRSGIFAGNTNQITKSDSAAIIGGVSNQVDCADRSVVIGGTGLVAIQDDTVYVPNLNINSVPAGVPVTGLAVDASGNVVQGAIGGSTGATVIIQDTAPTQRPDASPLQNGDLWWSSDTARLFVYYIDGDSSQWVQINLLVGGGGSSLNPDDFVAKTSATGSAEMPTGTTAERDPVPSLGWTRFNSDLDCLEVYTSGGWVCTGSGSGGGDPLTGKTFVPAPNQYLASSAVNNGPIGPTASGPVTVQSGSIDLTEGATVVIPAQATHVVLKTSLNMTVQNGSTRGNFFIEKSPGDLAAIPVTTDFDPAGVASTRLRWDAAPEPGQTEALVEALMVLEVDRLVDTLYWRLDANRASAVDPGDNIQWLSFHVQGWYIDDLGTQVGAELLPLAGKTFVPIDIAPLTPIFNETISSSFPNASLTQIQYPRTLDLTQGGSITIPNGATHVKLRVNMDAQNQRHNDKWLAYVEKDSSTVTAALGAFQAWKSYIDPAVTTASAPALYEDTDNVTFTIEFDQLTSTVEAIILEIRASGGNPITNAVDVRFWIEGFFINDTGNQVADPIPLAGKTYAPNDDSNSILAVANTEYAPVPVSATIVGPAVIDLTNGGAITIPVGATHAVLRALISGNTEENAGAIMYVEDTTAELATIPVGNVSRSRVSFDSQFSDISTGTLFEGESIATFTVPINTALDQVIYRIDALVGAPAPSTFQLVHRVWLEGFYIDDTGTQVDQAIIPLDNKTYAPVEVADPADRLALVSVVNPTPGSSPTSITVDSGTVDITNGGLITVPPNATHVKVRSLLNFNGCNDSYLYAEVDAATIASIAVGDTNAPRIILDGTETGLASVSEGNDTATYDVEIGPGNTFAYRTDARTYAGTPSVSSRFFIEGFYVQEQTTSGKLQALEGTTFVPVDQSASVEDSSFSGSVTVDATLIPASTIDLTDSGSITVPANATHVLLRTYTAVNPGENYQYQLYVEQDATALAAIALNDPDEHKVRLDPTQGGGTSYEQDVMSTFLVPIDTLTNTVTYRYDVELGAAAPGQAGDFSWRFWIEGFYVAESNNVIPNVTIYNEEELTAVSAIPNFAINGQFLVAGAFGVQNPVGAAPGQNGVFRLTATPTSWGTSYRFAGGSPPAGVVNGAIILYTVVSPTEIWMHNFVNNIL